MVRNNIIEVDISSNEDEKLVSIQAKLNDAFIDFVSMRENWKKKEKKQILELKKRNAELEDKLRDTYQIVKNLKEAAKDYEKERKERDKNMESSLWQLHKKEIVLGNKSQHEEEMERRDKREKDMEKRIKDMGDIIEKKNKMLKESSKIEN